MIINKMIEPREKNCLLVRDDVGRAKPVTQVLPIDGHVYGVPNKKESHGVGKLTADWQVHKQSGTGTGPKDFRKLNRM